MKKNYFAFVLLLTAGFFAVAQPVVTSASFQDFSVRAHAITDLTGITVGNAGANQTWNYNEVVPEEPYVYLRSIPGSSAPAHTEIPDANYFQEVSFILDDVIYQSYSFAKITSSSYEALGNIYSSGEFEGYLVTPVIPLPLSYTNSYVSTEQLTSDPTPTSSTSTYDAYGTLVTPYGTFTNVVRLKDVDESSTSYSWYRFDPYTPLMSIEISNADGLVTDATIWESTPPLATNQVMAVDAKISVFPNPTKNILNLRLPANTTIDKITITDLTGKTVQEQSQYKETVNVENLADGIYVLQATSGNNSFETKFVKQ